MKVKIFIAIIVLGLITVIPTVYGQLTLGSEAKQESIEVKINIDGEISVKHIVSSSNMPTSLPLFVGEISNLNITNELGEEIDSGIVNDVKGNLSVMVFPSNQLTIIEYDLENATLHGNLFSTDISYPKKFSVLFDESTDIIFFNNNVIMLENKKGISINGGGNAKIEFYENESKIIHEVIWEENKFDVEIISDSKIEKFDFNQPEKNISFQVNDENKFVTIMMSEELLGGPYVILLDENQIRFSKFVTEENLILLNIKPEMPGQITIIGTTVIPEFSMFIPLIMGFMIILMVPMMRKFTLR